MHVSGKSRQQRDKTSDTDKPYRTVSATRPNLRATKTTDAVPEKGQQLRENGRRLTFARHSALLEFPRQIKHFAVVRLSDDTLGGVEIERAFIDLARDARQIAPSEH